MLFLSPTSSCPGVRPSLAGDSLASTQRPLQPSHIVSWMLFRPSRGFDQNKGGENTHQLSQNTFLYTIQNQQGQNEQRPARPLPLVLEVQSP